MHGAVACIAQPFLLPPCVCCTGGKKGVDMAGMSDLGGVKFFNLAVETPEGDIEVLELVMQGELCCGRGKRCGRVRLPKQC